MTTDRLKIMWEQQKEFMYLLQEHRNFPNFPADVNAKDGQKIIKTIAHDCMHELFEAVHLLKNSKDHRLTDVGGLDKEAFKEELVDCLHYFYELCIMSGVSLDELYEAYMDKGQTNVERIKGNY